MRFPDIDHHNSDVVDDDNDEKRKPGATDIVSTALLGDLSILLLTGLVGSPLPIQSNPEERIRSLCVSPNLGASGIIRSNIVALI